MTRGTVVHYSGKPSDQPGSHESVTRAWIASRLARILDYDYGGEYEPARRYPGRLYFVPGDTLVGDKARALGIRDEDDLFGGVLPHAFLATKAVAHPVVEGGFAPSGWSHALGADLTYAVLQGYTAFTKEDARHAGRRVLSSGKARVKRGDGIGGRGQTVVANEAELDAAIDALDEASVLRDSLVIEQNLEEVTTFSVGRVRVGEWVATYVGTQQLTMDNQGAEVYAGSDLIVVRGDYDVLLALTPESVFRQAVEGARAFDLAVSQAYPGLFASRRNYDVAHGRDAAGKPRIGLLEQSWRLGGASPAEIAALEAFHDDPELRAVRACCVESYGDNTVRPPEATIYFCGVDERVGPLTKFVYVKDYGSAA
jgi:Protein of unknown function (DUF3182)